MISSGNTKANTAVWTNYLQKKKICRNMKYFAMQKRINRCM